ncbi:MAG: hypothetical protein HC939_05660 [Pleurocapsa sp. SU_5_0]|nr:hypothetical protein [Pleurocapsa sp. SU_5_0]NJR46094.1 hypothetical protein [Hyellaceae cyanobacterium CSU_1_1]
MFKYTLRFFSLLLLVSIGTKAQAQTIENTVTSESQPNQEQTLDNDQNNAAAINQTGIYNVGDAATYKIQDLGGRNVVCPKSSLIVGSGYNSAEGINFGENSSYAINASFIVPLGGKLGKACEEMGQALARKAQYDLEIINARSCAELISAGISLNSEKFPTLSVVCDGVSLVENNINQSKSSVQLEPQNSPSLNKNDDEESNNLNKIESTRLRDDETDENNEYF